MFSHSTMIRLCHTDATGTLFFPKQFEISLEALENFLHSCQFSMKGFLSSFYVFPVVHAEANYMGPLYLGDQVTIRLQVEEMKQSSVRFSYEWEKGNERVGRVEIVHVLVDRKTGKKHSLTPEFKQLFSLIMKG